MPAAGIASSVPEERKTTNLLSGLDLPSFVVEEREGSLWDSHKLIMVEAYSLAAADSKASRSSPGPAGALALE
jgi:hypothetical protein